MNLECLNNIITSNLAIHIDLTDLKSWDLNTGLTSQSLTKWSGAISDYIELTDFGLTGFDNGRMNTMWDGITLTPQDNLFSLYRVGYNNVSNPSTDETSGMTINTEYLPLSAVTTGTSGNYFDLTGGYLQGFFKLDDYNYEVLPSRYGKGITIETLVNLNENSQGIFYMMGARAEDKYNPYFSGETVSGSDISGVTTSFDNFLDSFQEHEELKEAFKVPEDKYNTVYTEAEPVENVNNNVIAFEITDDKKLAYKYVDGNNVVITNSSSNSINPATGWTMITIVYTPNEVIDESKYECGEQGLGKLMFYANGRSIWTIKDFPEFFFKGFVNDKEKQLGVPYSISWGGGSFGLAESWHYDYQTYSIYTGQDLTYLDDSFTVIADPISTECYTAPTGETAIDGLSISADTTTFTYSLTCEPDTLLPLPVMKITYTGGTGNTYLVKFNAPISTLSNRDYVVDMSVYVDNIFKSNSNSKISVLTYSEDVDVNIVAETEFSYPLHNPNYLEAIAKGLKPFPDGNEYVWSVDGIIYYGDTGYPVPNQYLVPEIDGESYLTDYAVTGNGSWLNLKTVFRTPDNSGQNQVSMGILIESDMELISGGTIFVNDFVYTAADILVQDERKNNLTIEQNFDSSFIGGIQKLRIYDTAFNSQEVLHNAMMENKFDPTKNMSITKGGRIINK